MKCGHVYKVNDITLVVNKGYSLLCNVSNVIIFS